MPGTPAGKPRYPNSKIFCALLKGLGKGHKRADFESSGDYFGNINVADPRLCRLSPRRQFAAPDAKQITKLNV
jgi:hypothetical protein